MKKILLLLLLFLAFSLHSQKKLSIITSEFSPFISEKSAEGGFITHMITLAFKESGYKVKFTYVPWARNYEEAKDGEYDASSYWYLSDERKKLFYYSDAVTDEKLVFFYKKGDNIKNWSKLTDLSQYKIGVTTGYTYTKEFWDLGNNNQLNLDSAASDLNNFQKLLKGRIDLFPSGIIGGYDILNQNFSRQIVQSLDTLETPLTRSTGHVLFLRSDPDSEKYLKIFNEGLKSIRDKGIYDRFYNKLLKGYYSVKK